MNSSKTFLVSHGWRTA